MASEQTQQYQPTEDEREEFDFFWQHLRRNAKYRRYYAVRCEAETFKKDAAQAFLGGDTKPNDRDAALEQLGIDLDPSRNVGGLGVPLDPDIQVSAEALTQLLTKRPDYFQSVLWPQARLKASGAVAWWNQFGAWGCVWSGARPAAGADFEGYAAWVRFLRRNFAQANKNSIAESAQEHEARKAKLEEVLKSHPLVEVDDVSLFYWLRKALDDAAANKDNNAESMQKYEDRKASMRDFLESSPRMDFVIDATLPWGTMSKELKKECETIKDLRERVGLERDVDPRRLRDWRKHLAVYDAYLSHWESNRRKFVALQRIRREELGFVKAFELVGVNLSDAERALAEELDRLGRKTVGLFKIKAVPITPDASKGGFDESGNVATVDFDYDEVEAKMDKAEVKVVGKELPSYATQLPQILATWRPHFNIAAVKLLAELGCPNGDSRRKWCRWARERIEAAWPYG